MIFNIESDDYTGEPLTMDIKADTPTACARVLNQLSEHIPVKEVVREVAVPGPIQYTVKEVQKVPGEKLLDLIRLVQNPDDFECPKIRLIKHVREMMGMGLKDAKEWVEENIPQYAPKRDY